jgi:hypothetical protein
MRNSTKKLESDDSEEKNGVDNVDGIQLTQDRVQWQVLAWYRTFEFHKSREFPD